MLRSFLLLLVISFIGTVKAQEKSSAPILIQSVVYVHQSGDWSEASMAPFFNKEENIVLPSISSMASQAKEQFPEFDFYSPGRNNGRSNGESYPPFNQPPVTAAIQTQTFGYSEPEHATSQLNPFRANNSPNTDSLEPLAQPQSILPRTSFPNIQNHLQAQSTPIVASGTFAQTPTLTSQMRLGQ